jgi:hypothetical protein
LFPRHSGDFDRIHYVTKAQAQLEGNFARLEGLDRLSDLLAEPIPGGPQIFSVLFGRYRNHLGAAASTIGRPPDRPEDSAAPPGWPSVRLPIPTRIQTAGGNE